MDEHKTQQPEPEIVPARRKSGRMRSWKASILACVICILVTALVKKQAEWHMFFYCSNVLPS